MVYIQRYLSFILLLSCFSILFGCDAPSDLVFDNPLDGKQLDNNDNPPTTQEIKFTQLTTNKGYDASPSWSPDGQTIVYTSSPNVVTRSWEEAMDIYTIPVNGGNPTKLTTFYGWNGSPSYSPDGSKILYTRNMNAQTTVKGIWCIPSNGGNPTIVYDSYANDFDASWSPDGKQIAFSSEMTTSHPSGQMIWIVASDGSGKGLKQMTSGNKGDVNPIWTPDGSKITFSSSIRGGLFYVPATGGNPEKFPYESNCFTSDGKWLAFVAERNGKSGIWIKSIPNGEPILVVEGSNIGGPCWSPDRTKIAFGKSDTPGDPNIWIASNLPTQ
jgi:Tol biopolymer transport system component